MSASDSTAIRARGAIESRVWTTIVRASFSLADQFTSAGSATARSGSSRTAVNISSAAVGPASSNPSATESRPEAVPSTPTPIRRGADQRLALPVGQAP